MKSGNKVGPFRIRQHVRDGQPTGQWQVDIPPHLSESGTRLRLSFGTKADATAEAERRYRERIHAVSGHSALQRRKCGITFDALVGCWLPSAEKSVEIGFLRRSTLQKNLYHLKSAQKSIGKLDLLAIDEERLRDYQLLRTQGGMKAPTINSELATILVLLNWAKSERKWLQTVPAVRQIPVDIVREELPEPSEVAQIISLLPKRLQPLVLVLACTGFRRGEVFHLPWHHVNLVKGTFLIAAHRDWKPKNPNSRREFQFSQQALDAIKGLPRNGYYVFPGRKKDQPIDNFRKALATAMKKFVGQGGRPLHVTPKTFRKAFASWQVLKGTPEVVTQDLLGHVRGSRVTQEAYTRLPNIEYLKAHIEIPIQEQQSNAPGEKLATVGNTPRKRGSAVPVSN